VTVDQAPDAKLIRVIVCDDSFLFREGVVRILDESGFRVVAHCDTGEDLLECAATIEADVAIVDVRMPPTYTNEGLKAALELGAKHPHLGVLVLSQFIETRATVQLLEHRGAGRGYLLKDRVADFDGFADAIARVAAGGSAVDPEVVASLVSRREWQEPLEAMSAREREILGMMAEGRSNAGICDRLILSQRTVESHVSAIFRKLGLVEAPDDHRRVLAVLAYLRV
jgi:DNA-binding NarL/FixJ family response regulator